MYVQVPRLTDFVLYRGRAGLKTVRTAIVAATLESLSREGVAAGKIPDLDDNMMLHLFVVTPSDMRGFTEYMVKYDMHLAPGTWCWPHDYYTGPPEFVDLEI